MMQYKDLVGKKLINQNEREEGPFDILSYSPRPFSEVNSEPGEGQGTTIMTFRPQYGRISFHRVWCTVKEYLKDHTVIGDADYAVLPLDPKRLEVCYEHETPLGPRLKETIGPDGWAITRCTQCNIKIAKEKAWHKEIGSGL